MADSTSVLTRAAKTLVLQERFLRAYADGFPTVTTAAATAKIDPSTHNKWLRGARYAKLFKGLQAEKMDQLEAEAFRRAVTGVERVVTMAGGVPVTMTEYSDTLLVLLLKANNPAKYKDRREVEHKVDINIWADFCRTAREEAEEMGLVVKALPRALTDTDGG